MGSTIKVDTAAITQAATKIEGYIINYESSYSKVNQLSEAVDATWDGTDNDNTIFHSSCSEAVSEWLKEIDVPEKYYPNYENCSFSRRNQHGKGCFFDFRKRDISGIKKERTSGNIAGCLFGIRRKHGRDF